MANVVVRAFKKRGIEINTGVMVNGHTPNDEGGTIVHFGEGENLEVDAVVVSVGRRPYADELGLTGTAVKVDQRGFVVVDEYCRTGEPGVYALGDLINTPQLAHVGYAEAIVAVKDILGERPSPSCTTGCPGRSTATRRWPGPVTARSRRRRPGSTWLSASTSSAPTAGPRSSARPRVS